MSSTLIFETPIQRNSTLSVTWVSSASTGDFGGCYRVALLWAKHDNEPWRLTLSTRDYATLPQALRAAARLIEKESKES